MSDYPRPIQKLLRQYLTLAYERELQRELAKLDQSFREWREGKISSGELSHRVHQYETGPSRELFKRYNGDVPDMIVAYAIVVGILKQEEIPTELLEAIARPLSSYRSLKERNELKEPDSV
jgi:hypothetical protein